MFNLHYVFIAAAILVIAAGQVMFKYAAQQLRDDPDQGYGVLLRENSLALSMIALALMLYLIATVAWIQALRTVPLSIAFMFNSLAFVLVPIAGFALFGEPVPRFFLIGLALIIAGIFVVSLG